MASESVVLTNVLKDLLQEHRKQTRIMEALNENLIALVTRFPVIPIESTKEFPPFS
jgi:hypothetical protein